MDISFIVPVYNSDKYLSECIDSILEQKLESFEIILINDGSSDLSADICKSYCRKYNTIIYLEQNNSGASFSRNRGMSIAQGDFLFFVDSDDRLKNIPWNSVFALLKNKKIDILGFDANRISESGENLGTISALNLNDNDIISGEMFIERHGYRQVQPMPWLYIFQKNFLMVNRLCYHEGCYHEDCEFCLKAICKATKITYLKEKFYIQRVNPMSIMQTVNLKKSSDLITVSNEIDRFIDTLDFSKKAKVELLKYVSYLNWMAIKTCIKQGGDIKNFVNNNKLEYKNLKYSYKYIIIAIFIKFKWFSILTKVMLLTQ